MVVEMFLYEIRHQLVLVEVVLIQQEQLILVVAVADQALAVQV